MTDDPDFDLYDNDAFNDKAFADLLNGLKEVEVVVRHSSSINFPGSRNDETSRTTPKIYDHEYKFPS